VNSAIELFLSNLKRHWTIESLDKTCAFLIVSRLFLFRYRNDISSQTVSSILHFTCPLLCDNRRAVVQSAIELLGTMVGTCTDVTVGQFLEIVMPSLFEQNEDCGHHFRFLTRKVLVKVGRKFGAEILNKWIPPSHQKQLSYIRKIGKANAVG